MHTTFAWLPILAISLAVASLAPVTVDNLDWNLTPTQITQSCNAQIHVADTSIRAMLAKRSKRTFQNVVLPLENALADLNDALVAQSFLAYVSSDKGVRDASNDCQTTVGNYYSELTARPELEKAVAAAQASNTAKNVYDRKLTELWLTSLRRAGAGLPTAHRKEFVQLSQRLNDLETRFASNIAEDASTIVISARQTGGLPADVLASYTKNADGTYTLPVNESTVSFLEYSTDESARKAYYLVYNNRVASSNVPLLEQAIATRDRLAHLIGYENWATYVLADRMASSPARVFKFLDGLDERILPKSRDDIATLTQLKAEDTKDPHAVLNPWDISHYDYVLNKTRYAVDAAAIRQYFPVEHTIEVVLQIYHTLLGVTFTQQTPQHAWTPDLLEYRVNDTASGKLLGYTYFDIYPRPGKYGHFANFPILPYRKTSDGARVPIAVIVGNWPKPGSGEPALLSHDDVVTFFHEFGHDMAALLTTAPYETLSSGFRQDFVEAPSQMLENFIWQPSILKQISSNWQTGQPLPDDLIAKLVAARYVDNAYATTRQIVYASIDMDYHTMGPHVDTTAVWAKVANAMSAVPMVPGTHPQATFGHIMGGYDAGYYGYLWSKVYAQDLFTAFLSGRLENPSVGMRYRQTILVPARTYEPDVEVEHFLGRPMNPSAFYSEFDETPAPSSPDSIPKE